MQPEFDNTDAVMLYNKVRAVFLEKFAKELPFVLLFIPEEGTQGRILSNLEANARIIFVKAAAEAYDAGVVETSDLAETNEAKLENL